MEEASRSGRPSTVTPIDLERSRRAAQERSTAGVRRQNGPGDAWDEQDRGSEIESIFKHFVDPVYRFIYRQVGNQQDAEDLTSEVFLSASRNLDVERPSAAIGRWLFTVSRTVIADHWRRYYRVPPLVDIDDLQVAENSPSGDGEGRAAHNSQAVARVLSELPQRYREVLELRFLSGYTLSETATALGISVENVKITQHRALAKAVLTADEVL